MAEVFKTSLAQTYHSCKSKSLNLWDRFANIPNQACQLLKIDAQKICLLEKNIYRQTYVCFFE